MICHICTFTIYENELGWGLEEDDITGLLAPMHLECKEQQVVQPEEEVWYLTDLN